MAESDESTPLHAEDLEAIAAESSEMGIKKFERLLDLMREGHRQRIDSIRRIDDKATRYLTVLGFTSVIFIVEARMALDSFLPPRDFLDWASLLLLVLIVIVVASALVSILKVIAVHELKFLEPNQDLITTFSSQSELDALSGTIFFFRDADASNQAVAIEKLKNINKGFRLTVLSLILSILAVAATSIDVADTKPVLQPIIMRNSFIPSIVGTNGGQHQMSKSMDSSINQTRPGVREATQPGTKPQSNEPVSLNPNAKRPQGGVLSESKVPKPREPKK